MQVGHSYSIEHAFLSPNSDVAPILRRYAISDVAIE